MMIFYKLAIHVSMGLKINILRSSCNLVMTLAALDLVLGVPPVNLDIEQVVDDASDEWSCTYHLLRKR